MSLLDVTAPDWHLEKMLGVNMRVLESYIYANTPDFIQQ